MFAKGGRYGWMLRNFAAVNAWMEMDRGFAGNLWGNHKKHLENFIHGIINVTFSCLAVS